MHRLVPAKIQSMKKAVPKGDNKRRKDVNAETARLEQALQERHERELAPVETSYIGNGQSGGASVSVLEGMVGEVKVGGEEGEGRKKIMDEEKPAKKSRAQKRKVIKPHCCFYSLSTHLHPLPTPLFHPHIFTPSPISPFTHRRRRHYKTWRDSAGGRRKRRRWTLLIPHDSGRERN